MVPGIGFDPLGVRLGWGKGYYDRFLGAADVRALKIGIAYEVQIAPWIAPRPHDVPMDFVITEDRVVDCGRIRELLKKRMAEE